MAVGLEPVAQGDRARPHGGGPGPVVGGLHAGGGQPAPQVEGHDLLPGGPGVALPGGQEGSGGLGLELELFQDSRPLAGVGVAVPIGPAREPPPGLLGHGRGRGLKDFAQAPGIHLAPEPGLLQFPGQGRRVRGRGEPEGQAPGRGRGLAVAAPRGEDLQVPLLHGLLPARGLEGREPGLEPVKEGVDALEGVRVGRVLAVGGGSLGGLGRVEGQGFALAQFGEHGVQQGQGGFPLVPGQADAHGQDPGGVVRSGPGQLGQERGCGAGGVQGLLQGGDGPGALGHRHAAQVGPGTGPRGAHPGQHGLGQARRTGGPQFLQPVPGLGAGELGLAALPTPLEGGAEVHRVGGVEGAGRLGALVLEVGQEHRSHRERGVEALQGRGQAQAGREHREVLEVGLGETGLDGLHVGPVGVRGLLLPVGGGQEGEPAFQPRAVLGGAGAALGHPEGQGKVPQGPGQAHGQERPRGLGAAQGRFQGQVGGGGVALAVAGQGLENVPGLPGALAPEGAGNPALVHALAGHPVIALLGHVAPAVAAGREFRPDPPGVLAQHVPHGAGAPQLVHQRVVGGARGALHQARHGRVHAFGGGPARGEDGVLGQGPLPEPEPGGARRLGQDGHQGFRGPAPGPQDPEAVPEAPVAHDLGQFPHLRGLGRGRAGPGPQRVRMVQPGRPGLAGGARGHGRRAPHLGQQVLPPRLHEGQELPGPVAPGQVPDPKGLEVGLADVFPGGLPEGRGRLGDEAVGDASHEGVGCIGLPGSAPGGQ